MRRTDRGVAGLWVRQTAAFDIRLEACSTRPTRGNGTSRPRHGRSPGWPHGPSREMPDRWTDNRVARQLSAGYEMIERSRLTHERPPFGIDAGHRGRRGDARAGGDRGLHALLVPPPLRARTWPIPEPMVLLVTALAGHFSTLLRATVRSLLPDHDVYVTDWHNARDVGLEHGSFGLDDYIGQVIAFLEHIGPGAHVRRRLPALPGGPGRHVADGGQRQPGPAQEPHPHGRSGRHPGQPHQGQRAGPLQAAAGGSSTT